MIKDCKGIVVAGDLSESGIHQNVIEVSIYDPRRIAAVKEAAERLLHPEDRFVQVLDRAVRDGFPDIDLPPIDEPDDAIVLARVLDHVSNGNDGAPARAAEALRYSEEKTRVRECHYCDGTGELHG